MVSAWIFSQAPVVCKSNPAWLGSPNHCCTISAAWAPPGPCSALPSSCPPLVFCPSSLHIYISTFQLPSSLRKICLCWQSSHVACTEDDNDKDTIGSDNTMAEVIAAVVTCCVVGTALNPLCTHLLSEQACNFNDEDPRL